MSKNLLFVVALLTTIQTQAQWDTLANIPEKLSFPVVAVVSGKIHIMGGGGTGGATDSHYAYDPASNTWSPKADVPYLAQQPAGGVINGKIHYLGGGYPNTGSRLNDHWIYDPSSDSWAEADTIPIPRAIHEAASINGQLFVMSGQPDKARCESFNPSTSTWTLRNSLPDQNFWYSAITERNNKIYRFGGGGYTAPTDAAHVYNSTNDSWSSLPDLPMSNHSPDAAAIGDTIYISGGYFGFADADILLAFDLNSETYDTLTPLPIGRSYHNMVSLDDCLYVLGGNNALDDSVGYSMIRICLDDLYESGSGDTNTSVLEVDDAESFRTYASHDGTLVIESIERSRHQLLTLEIIDLAGRLVDTKELKLCCQRMNIPITVPSSGLYIIRLSNDSEQQNQMLWLQN